MAFIIITRLSGSQCPVLLKHTAPLDTLLWSFFTFYPRELLRRVSRRINQGKRRAETRRVYDLHRYYTRIIFHGTRTTDDRQRRQSRGTGTVSAPISKPAKRSFSWRSFGDDDDDEYSRRPTRRRKYSERAKVFTSAFTAGPFRRVVRRNLSLDDEPPRDHHLASFYQRAEGERGVSRITRWRGRLLFNFLRVTMARLRHRKGHMHARVRARRVVASRARKLRMMYKGLRESKWTRLRIFVFRDPLVGDHLDGRYVSRSGSLPRIPFSETTAHRGNVRSNIDPFSLFCLSFFFFFVFLGSRDCVNTLGSV